MKRLRSAHVYSLSIEGEGIHQAPAKDRERSDNRYEVLSDITEVVA